jgi:biopolymer transport protein ExbD
MGRSKKKGIDDNIEDLNLVPIMNLVVCLIPMVLLGTALVKVGVINVNAPNFGMGKSSEEKEDDKKPLNLTLLMGEKGLMIKASIPLSAIIKPTDGVEVSESGITIREKEPFKLVDVEVGKNEYIKKPFYHYNYPVLYSLLAQIKDGVKDQYPKDTVIKLGIDANIPVKHIIEAMDSIRFRLEKDTYSKEDDFMEAAIKYEEVDGKRRPIPLWPDVMFAAKVQ